MVFTMLRMDKLFIGSFPVSYTHLAVGRADVVIKMQEAIYVFEFKVDGTPEEALAQINSCLLYTSRCV